MKRSLAAIFLTAALAMTSCALKENKPLESGWKFESMTSNGQTFKPKNFKEEDTPLVSIIKDNYNEGSYYIYYRRDGKNRAGVIKEEDGSCRVIFNDSEEMQAKVSGDRLTLTSDKDKDFNIRFSYTDDQILIPVDDMLAPHYLKARMTGNCTVDITNESDSEYMYGKFFRLEVEKDGKWYYAREKQPYAWTAQGLVLPPHETNTEKYSLEPYGSLEAGKYRLAVGDTDAVIYAEFTVNADGSFSYPE